VTHHTDRLNTALAGRYRIEKHLGAGGMATVYLAYDEKHDRKVAIKVLKPELAAVLGAERFVVEIKTTASLSHPHILPLFDSGTADGFLFYVMPYIQGETIREKLNRETQFGVDEAVRIAREVADALDYAHRNGVIHRDIKPENILLHDGRAMVMDFGIAIAVSAAAGGRMTETGLSLGTPHYMSPEQATAEKEITGRSDVYSLGSVLYEMLTGNPPHIGANAQQVIMKIISEPAEPVTKYRKSVPPNVAAAVAKSVEKLPADRFESAKAFSDALQNAAFTTATQVHVVAATGWRARAAVPLAAASVVLAAALGWQALKPQAEPAPMRLDLATSAAEVMVNSDVVISHDGSMLAYIGLTNAGTAVYLRRLAVDVDFRKVQGTDSALVSPSFSPDDQWLVFRRGNEMIKVSVNGGSAQRLARMEAQIGNFPHWGPNNQIIYSGGPGGVVRLSSDGSSGTSDTVPGSRGAARYSYLLPDGSGMLISRPAGIYFLDFKTDSATRLLAQGTHPVYAESGHILYISDDGGLFAVPFDLGGHHVTGTPVRVVERVAAGLAKRGFSVSRGGTLVYQEGQSFLEAAVGSPTELILGEFSGKIDTLRLPRGRRLQPRFSPDGRQVAFEANLRGGQAETDIVTIDLISGTTTRLTFDGDNDDPVWSPDGKRIAFTKGKEQTGEDIYVKPSDNSGSEQVLLSQPGGQNPTAWITPDTILLQSNATGASDVFWFSLKENKATPYMQGPWAETDLQVSRDGKLAAFMSFESGSVEVWLRDFPVPNGKWQVSTTGGRMPRWSSDGRDLYYWRQGAGPVDSLYRVRIDRTPSVRVNTPQLVLTHDIIATEGWDVHPDGKRFVAFEREVPRAQTGTGAPTLRYVIVPNWFTELKAKTAEKK
jgi:Tol biopolymer transport system component/tRNA A-37 threonylcarbamoyl transferase component Bud32